MRTRSAPCKRFLAEMPGSCFRRRQPSFPVNHQIERKFHYDLGGSIEELRPGHGFDVSCQGTVPAALLAFLDSTDYESAVRLAVSLGGDCDTLACIAGGIAQAHYGGVPQDIREQTLARMDDDLRRVVEEFEERFPAAAG
jgi:ADP-ribosylglycohydrolase